MPFAAGSATDQLARALGQAVTEATRQPVIVDDKPGANSFIGAQFAAKAPKDGYTVLITTNTTHAANEHLYKTLTYHPVKDYAPISLLGKGGQIMVVYARSTCCMAIVQDLVGAGAGAPVARQAVLRLREFVQPHRRRTASSR